MKPKRGTKRKSKQFFEYIGNEIKVRQKTHVNTKH